MSSRSVKEILFEGFAAVAKAAAHPHRLALLEQLAQGERSVEALADIVGLSVANASQHLQLMRRAGLVSAQRRGQFVLYRVSDSSVLDLLATIGRVAERRVTEVENVVRTYYNERDSMEPVSRAVLKERLEAGLVTVLDVRPADEFAAGHVPGAVNIPLADIEAHVAGLDPNREIVAYCRGAYCVLAFEAVAALRARGFTAHRLEDGLPEWAASGLPVETA